MRPLLLFMLLLLTGNASSQKYNFVNWTVEDGLVQSQASFMCQDVFRQLWVGTEGGLSCFDGHRFKSYTVQDGLPANHISCMLSTADSSLLIGTSNGLVRFNGATFSGLQFGDTKNAHVRAIAQAGDALYALANLKLYEITGDSTRRIVVSGDSTERISTVQSAGDGRLIACVYGVGIYCGRGDTWQLAASLSEELYSRVIFRAFVSSAGDTLLASNRGLQVIRNGQTEPFTVNGQQPEAGLVLCMAEDEQKHLWVGTEKGAYEVADNTVTFFSGHSGFSDNSVNHIYKDAEGNLWFATNADGIYKFRENTFTYYDKSSGLTNPIIMGVVQTPDDKIYVAGYGGGLFYTLGAQLMQAPGTELLDNCRINCLYAESNGGLLIGTLNRGIFRYDPARRELKQIGRHDILPLGATVFSEDSRGNILVGTGQGLFVRNKTGKATCPAPEIGLVTALKPFDEDHHIMGTSHGLYLVDTAFNVAPYYEEKFGKALVMCIAINGNRLFVGTSDKGVYLLDIHTGKVTNYNTADGLPNNFIYSIDAAEKGHLWAGTGFGISKLELDGSAEIVSIKNYGRADGLLGMECNHNSLLRAKDSGLWFGTTKGLFHFDPNAKVAATARPLVLLRSVKLHSAPVNDSSLYSAAGKWFDVPEGLSLSSRQNHLSFELGALYYTNPDDIIFRYKLDGIDKGYTTTNNPLIIYPALPPGNYVLRVKALTKSGVLSVNEVSYPFVIHRAFYQTSLFQLLVIVVLLGTGALIAWLITRARHKRRQREKELLARIREEEFSKLRQRTAEDFHDEMGNSLTRISVLTDVLKVKLNGTEKEVSHLVQQIKDNTTALYNGSRDIIWSLNSKHDALFEIAEHIKDIGSEMFQDTPVEFHYAHNIPAGNGLRLKLDYSRNLTMVFKEAYTNVLKHAGASRVEVKVDLKDDNSLQVRLSDNGSGFRDLNRSGNGLKNMENRVRRLQGEFSLNSRSDAGTEINISFKDIFVN